MKKTVVLSPTQKALQINLDNSIYGTFAEIGAGQEVVRYFFRLVVHRVQLQKRCQHTIKISAMQSMVKKLMGVMFQNQD